MIESKLKRTQVVFAVCVLFPIVGYFGAFLIFPIISSFYMSFSYWNLLDPKHYFVGIDNYKWNFSDPIFWQSLKNTLYYTAGCVSLLTILGLILALWINSIGKTLGRLMEVMFFIPVLISWVVASIFFQWLYQPSYGILNHYLGKIGLGPYRWLTSSSTVMPSIILMSVWKSVGFGMIILRAGLLGIPNVYHEAATVDGANKWQVFWRVTLPLLMPALLLVVVTNIIWSFQVFSQVYVMTQGGPGTASMVLVLRMYQLAFEFFRMGRGAALAVILFLLIVTVTLIQIKFSRGGFKYYQ